MTDLTYSDADDHRDLYWLSHEITAETEDGPTGTARGLAGCDSTWHDVVAHMNRLDDTRQRLVDAVDERAVVRALAAIPSTHRLAVAARLALADRADREERARAEKSVACDISAAADWTYIANNHIPFEEIQRRRREVA